MIKTTYWILLVVLWVSPDVRAAELIIRVIDEQSKSLVPVRVELLNEASDSVIADNAVPISRECVFAPMPTWLRQGQPKTIENPFSGTTQHYLSGVGRYSHVQPGNYVLRVFRGPEYQVATVSFLLRQDESKELIVTLDRWYDAPGLGWYGADDHLHLARLNSHQNESLGHWMSAEGLHIANFLQMGTLTQFGAASQYAFGDEGAVNSSGVLLLSGQEQPRTHIFGHEITLGASSPIDERQDYALYDRTFAKGIALGGISGFAHWGIGPASYGLALTVPDGNVEFLEVLNFEFATYELWYQLLNLGFPIAATAGTDFPCLSTMPGRERFYTRIEGQPTRSSFVEGLRKGRTFVTNGAMLALTVDGTDIGDRTMLSESKTVSVVAKVYSDPRQDQIERVELVRNGRVIHEWVPTDGAVFEVTVDVLIDEPSWFALRASGTKVGETLPSKENNPLWVQAAYENWISGAGGTELDEYLASRVVRESFAHTSPIYFDFEDAAVSTYDIPTESHWLSKLDEIESLIKSDSYDDDLILDWLPYSDGISAKQLRLNGSALLNAISRARRVFEERLSQP